VPGPVAVPVVFDVNVLVLAVAVGESPFRSWPSAPPTSGNPSAECLGVVNAAEFALWVSPHILANAGRVLATVLKSPDEEVDDYLRALAEMAEGVRRRHHRPAADCRRFARTGRTTGSWIWRRRQARSWSSLPTRTS
jgi:hypothetical protein